MAACAGLLQTSPYLVSHLNRHPCPGDLLRFRSRVEEHTPLLGPAVMDLFFLLNCLSVVVGVCCTVQRRHALYAALRPLDPRWAALTFPLVSTATVSLYYANEYSLRGWRREAAWTAHASAAWSYLIVPITLVLVPITVSRLWVSGMDAMCES